MFFRSIRFKVIVWYTIILTLTLLSFSAILYGSFSKALIDDLDDLLSSKADGVANSIDTYWQAKELETSVREEDLNDFVKIAANWVEEKRKDPDLMSIFDQILNVNGERLISSKSMPHITPLAKEDFDDILEGDDSFDTVKGETVDGKKMRFRVYTKPVIEGGRVMYVVQVAGPIGLLSVALNNLRFILFVLLPLTVLLAAIPGVLLVRITLRPVDTMINTLRQITAENLKLKIHLPDTKDEIKRLADTFNDMIERLDKSFSSQQNFIQDVSSELKAPLSALKEEFESALKKASSPEEYDFVLRRALKEIKKFSELIDSLLVLAGFDNSQVALEIKKVNLTRTVSQVLNDTKKEAEEKGIIVSSFLQDTIILDGDESQIRQLLMNLVDNAIKYTHRKGKITVAAHRDKRLAKVTVSDTGIGIEEEELPYIFDRFYQIHKSHHPNAGFGLGLNIAKAVAEAHKGTISVESQTGKGSTFTVTLPLSYPV